MCSNDLVLVQESVLPRLLRLRQARHLPLQAAVREALALVGYTDPVKGRGIRILAIDGGGTRYRRSTEAAILELVFISVILTPC